MTETLRLPTADAPPVVQPNPTHCSVCGRKIRVKFRRGQRRWLNHAYACPRGGRYPDVELPSDESDSTRPTHRFGVGDDGA